MGQQAQGGQQAQAHRPPPMYMPSQIRTLPTLTEDEKDKYGAGLQSLWTKANSSTPNSPENLAAKQKIVDFTRMLVNKIQARRMQQTQQLQQQQQAQQQNLQQQGGQQQNLQQQQAQQQNLQQQQQLQQQQMQQQMQQTQQQQAQQQQGQNLQQQQVQPRPQQVQPNPAGQQQQQQNVANTAAQPSAAVAGGAQRPNAQNPQGQQQQRAPIPGHISSHVNKMTFRTPAQLAEKPAEAAKWIEDIKDRYGRALMTMESSKQKVAQIDKVINDRAQAGTPFTENELQQLQVRKEQQLKQHQDAFKWVDSVRKSQGNLQGVNQAAQGNAAAAQAAQQTAQANAAQAQSQAQAQQSQQTQAQAQAQNQAQAKVQAQNNAQSTVQNMTPVPANAAVEAAKQQMANRASPAAGPVAAAQQARQAQATPQPQQQQMKPQAQPVIKQEPPHPGPVNTAIASAAAQQQQQQAGTPTQQAARVQTPQQTATPVTVNGPTRALSHSAAMNLANQRAVNTPGSAPVPPGQQPNSGASTPAPGQVNQGINMPQQQPAQGHPHAHPPQPQQQATIQSKMPIPKQLPEKATAVPQGVAVGGGVNTGRPTMSQGSGTLGGVMNQPPMNRIPAYNHEAEGDHVLSKKKLDELVRQVCGGNGESQDGNLLTPEVEENVLNMADSFVDNVLHAACRNSKERGSKVLEIRDIQLVLERAYNIRVPGYSSDELRTVRKIQPSAGWIAKMSAVQAAKVMPGKND